VGKTTKQREQKREETESAEIRRGREREWGGDRCDIEGGESSKLK
jgi:hypothetical protein